MRPDDFDDADEEEDVDEDGEDRGNRQEVDAVTLIHPAELVLVHHPIMQIEESLTLLSFNVNTILMSTCKLCMAAWVRLEAPSLTLSARKATGPHPALSSPRVRVVRGLQKLWGLVRLGG